MDQPRQQLLTGAALAQNEDRGRELRDTVDQIDDTLNVAARPDDELTLGGVRRFSRQHLDLPRQRLPFERPTDQRADGVRAAGLGDEMKRAELYGFHGMLEVGRARGHDDFGELEVLARDP